MKRYDSGLNDNMHLTKCVYEFSCVDREVFLSFVRVRFESDESEKGNKL